MSGATQHHDAYFQQYVNYTISAELDIRLNRINGHQTLIYKNQSPDTLSQLYFHLYLNKYRKGAYRYGHLSGRERGSIEIFEIRENDSLQTVFFVDHTILHLPLKDSLLPGDSVRLDFKFASKLPPSSGRYGYYGTHYDVGNWYPTPVVYDRAGWHLNQYIDNEFYQEWGDFRVDIKVPAGFVVGATGDLLNPEETMPDTSSERKKWYHEHPDDTTMTVWRYEARKVHDFAWTADPDYVWFQSEWNGITINVLAMEHNAPEWKQVTEFGRDALQYLSERFGDYPYKQITIADTYIRAGGIEYPQITFINTYTSPLYALDYFRAVIIHEMAHNWYYGMLASNQTEVEWLDEGFTTMAEILCMEHLYGTDDNYSLNRSGWLAEMFHVPVSLREYSKQKVLQMIKTGEEIDPVHTMPDRFRGDVFTSQYEKAAMILFMLQNVVGDSLFFQGLKNYYAAWRFKHPYPEDFIRVMEKTCNRDLDWFFDQWLHTTRTLDYAIKSKDERTIRDEKGKTIRAVIEIENAGDIHMPVDVDITLKNGAVERFHIPVDHHAKRDTSRRILRYWHFSQKAYRMEVRLEDAVNRVVIDPDNVLLDINRLNNSSGFLPEMQYVFMKPQSYHPPTDRYLWEIWPLIGFNDIDWFKTGLKFAGSYLGLDHEITARLWLNIRTQNADFDLRYQHPVVLPYSRSVVMVRGFHLDGRQGGEAALQTTLSGNLNGYNYTKGGIRFTTYETVSNAYPLHPWDRGNINTLDISVKSRSGSYWHTRQRFELGFTNSVLGSKHSFGIATMKGLRNIGNSRSDNYLRIRMQAGHAAGDIPVQHRFSLSGSTGWERFANPLYRSRGTLPYPLYREGHLVYDEAAGVRGTTLYREEGARLGKNVLALNGDFFIKNPLDHTLLYILRDLKPNLFFDLGQIWNKEIPDFSAFQKSAGFGITYDRIGLTGRFLDIDSIQMHCPLWMSHPAEGDDQIAWRWLLNVHMRLE